MKKKTIEVKAGYIKLIETVNDIPYWLDLRAIVWIRHEMKQHSCEVMLIDGEIRSFAHDPDEIVDACTESEKLYFEIEGSFRHLGKRRMEIKMI